ncbi:hypothetical protein L3Q82_009859, partial [Scortum barcoo]
SPSPKRKVLLGVFGVVVVVVLIAVPTAIYLKDKEYLHKSQGAVTLYDVITGDITDFLSKDVFDQKNAYDYQVSADRRYVALMSNYVKLWRHSFTASYSLYDRETNAFVTSAGIPEKVQYFAWAPEGNKLAYVWENNVYIKTSPGSTPKQVTFNGEGNLILNGIPDWVYEEEMFSSNQGFWWSPGGKYVAYVEFNDTGVHTIEYSWYGDNQYPSTVSIPYPKPGTPNPVVKLFIVDTDNTTNIAEVVVPDPFKSSEHYLATVTWITDESIAVQWLQRLQSHLILQIYNLNVSRWDPGEKLEVNSVSGWIGRFSPPEPVFATDKSSYYLLMSDSNGYKHIHHVFASKPTAITSGTWEVIDILKVTADSVLPSTHSHFSTGPGIPYHSIMDNKNKKELKVLENNEAFSSLISDIQMPTMDRATIKVAGLDLWYQMFLPPGFDKTKKYPLLIDVYAGPCSQKADYIYRVSWSTYLASTEKIIVASFDGRGSGFQGDKLMHAIYKSLGSYEVEDQITAAREFIKMGFIDKDRVAIWGWSYGGYVTSMALGAGSGVFKCGMAVAPVSKWVYYDSIYTERYMMQPSENEYAYTNSTVTARAKNFHSVQYLLVHGTADDNVHFQQAAEISEALVDEQVDFEAMVITMKSIHSLAGILLVLGFVQSSWQVPLHEADDSSSFEADDTLADEPRELSNMKRHSEGTFSNDYSKYLEDRKAQDFVRWLMNNKRSGAAEKRHADGTFTSDVSSYLTEQAIKDFVAKLKSGQVRRESETDRRGEAFSRRHVDGSFTSDVNKVLDSMAAKEYLLWVMTSKPSGESKKRQEDQ